MGYKNIKENWGEMSIISLKISGKIREFFPEIVVAALHNSALSCFILNETSDMVQQ